MMMGAPMNAKDVGYKYASFNDKLSSFAEPIRVRQGQRILFRFLNASATENVSLALPMDTCLPSSLWTAEIRFTQRALSRRIVPWRGRARRCHC